MKYSTSRTAQKLDISTETLKRWYKWYEDDDYVKPVGLKLPSYVTDRRNTKFFSDIAVLELMTFKKQLEGEYRGCMADFNAKYQWGKRGQVIIKNKEKKKGDKNE